MIDTGTAVAIFALIVSLFGSAITLAFYCGTLSQRVSGLEQWRQEVRDEFTRLHDAIRKVGELITNGSNG